VQRIEYLAAAAFLWVLERLPPAAAVRVAEGVGLALGKAVRRWKLVADANLRLAMPELDASGRRSVLRSVYRNLGRVAVALAKLPGWSEAEIRRHVDFAGLDHFLSAQAKGRGVLLLTAHLGNWELGALAHGALLGPMGVVVRPLPNRLVDALVESRRRSHGNQVIDKRSAAREILRSFAANGTVGILADQHASGEEAVQVDFLGLRAAANKGPAQLALRSGAAVVPAAARWDAVRGKHVVTYRPEVELLRSGDPARDVAVNTQRFQRAIESLVRETPEQWLWIHRRWKGLSLPDARKPTA